VTAVADARRLGTISAQLHKSALPAAALEASTAAPFRPAIAVGLAQQFRFVH
jgi:hypothetical protein